MDLEWIPSRALVSKLPALVQLSSIMDLEWIPSRALVNKLPALVQLLNIMDMEWIPSRALVSKLLALVQLLMRQSGSGALDRLRARVKALMRKADIQSEILNTTRSQ